MHQRLFAGRAASQRDPEALPELERQYRPRSRTPIREDDGTAALSSTDTRWGAEQICPLCGIPASRKCFAMFAWLRLKRVQYEI